MRKNASKFRLIYQDKFLLIALFIVLALHYSQIITPAVDNFLITFFASIATLPVLISAFQSIRNKKVNIDLLAGIALIVSLINNHWASAVFINLMLTSARIFSTYTENKSRQAIKHLMKLRPEKVKVKRGAKIVEEPISKIKKGDLIVIELGERIPVDGIIVHGEALLDQSSLTGESLPVDKKTSDEVLSSTLNVSGSITIRAERVGRDTTFEKVIQLVEQSQKDKIGIKTLADKFTGLYIALTLIGIVILYFYSHSLNLVLSVLLVTCADDIAVAIPMAFSATIGRAAQLGIIIKGGAFLEGLTRMKTLVLDKTGTITYGRMHVGEVVSSSSLDPKEVLKLAATAEFFSEHPVAKAVVSYAQKEKINFEKPADFQEIPGKGSTAIQENKKIVCGKSQFMEEMGIVQTQEYKDKSEPFKKDGAKSLLLVGYDSKLVGFITLEDEIRPEVKESIARIKKYGVSRIVMLTGDNAHTAAKVANEIGLTAFHANLLPEEKLKFIRSYLGKEGKVGMVGDGVNDAAALALADIGIAMGAVGSDTAIEAADIALMKDDFSKIPDAIGLGLTVSRIAKQNFILWGVINAIGLGLVFGRIIGPEGAAAFNFVTDFFPIVNSLRLFNYKSLKSHDYR